jgi:hypothetical protein
MSTQKQVLTIKTLRKNNNLRTLYKVMHSFQLFVMWEAGGQSSQINISPSSDWAEPVDPKVPSTIILPTFISAIDGGDFRRECFKVPVTIG